MMGEKMMFCENCGTILPEGAKFCAACGAKTEAPPAYAEERQPVPVPSPAYAPPVQTPPPPRQSYAPQPPYGAQVSPGGEPLRVGQYIGMLLLMCVPILSVILLFMWSFGGSVNLNKKNFARAMLIFSAVGVILSVIFGAALTSTIGELIEGMGGYY